MRPQDSRAAPFNHITFNRERQTKLHHGVSKLLAQHISTFWQDSRHISITFPERQVHVMVPVVAVFLCERHRSAPNTHARVLPKQPSKRPIVAIDHQTNGVCYFSLVRNSVVCQERGCTIQTQRFPKSLFGLFDQVDVVSARHAILLAQVHLKNNTIWKGIWQRFALHQPAPVYPRTCMPTASIMRMRKKLAAHSMPMCIA